jgi:hypothetical protein
VLLKSSSNAEHWFIFDSERDAINPNGTFLVASSSGIEGGSYNLDFCSNGFKLRSTLTEINGSGYTYIFLAFSEHPFKYTTAR